MGSGKLRPIVVSLLQAIVRLDGEALVLHSGDHPRVLTSKGPVEVGTRALPANVIAELAEDLLSTDCLAMLRTFGTAAHALPPLQDFAGERFTVAASRRRTDWSLVIQREKPIQTVEPARPSRAARFPPLVLLIDDSLDQLDLYELALSDRFAVLTTHMGDAGVVLAIAEQPDAIVVDLNMPRMNGWEVCQQLKAHQETMDIPVIVLTATDGPRLEEQAARAGAWELLRKPCPVDVLRDHVGLAVQH